MQNTCDYEIEKGQYHDLGFHSAYLWGVFSEFDCMWQDEH